MAAPAQVPAALKRTPLHESIGLALRPAAAAAVGTEFAGDIRGRGAARVVPTPFYKRKGS